MYRFGLWLLVLIGLLSAAAGSGAAPASAAGLGAATASACEWFGGTGGIAGHVTRPGGTPEPYVAMDLYTTDGWYIAGAYPYASGAYQFSGLTAGSYLLYANSYSTQGYAPEWFDSQIDGISATPIVVTDGYTATADVELALGAQISGQVLASDGGPLRNVSVGVYNRQRERVAYGVTDAGGVYTTTPGLASGEYWVSFLVPSGQPYLAEFYGDGQDFDTASLIQVTAPEPVVNINATLDRGAQIAGHLTHAETGDPVRAWVYVSGPGTRVSAYANSSGYYQTNGLASGTYQITFDRHSESQDLFGSTQVITVTAPNTLTLDSTLWPGAHITGRITDPAGDPISGVYVGAYGDGNNPTRSASTDASGVYTVTALATGEWSLWFNAAGYVTEYYNDQPDYGQRSFVKVTAPSVTTGIDAVLEPGGRISGTVTAADTGLPLAEVDVSAYDLDGEWITDGETDEAGQYQITGLPSGHYRLEFEPYWEEGTCAYQPEWYNDQASFETAVNVTVTSGQITPNIDAALERGSFILGQVVDADTAAPLDSTDVTVYDAQGQPVAWGDTTFLGHYMTFPALPSGEYRLLFSDYDGGYVDEYYADAPTLAAAHPVAVTAPVDVQEINAALVKGGRISGRVTAWDTDGGLPGVAVTVYAANGEAVGYAWTDAEGRYTVEDGLATGSYRVGFDPYPVHDPDPEAAAVWSARSPFSLPAVKQPEAAAGEAPVDAAPDPAAALNLPAILEPLRPLRAGLTPPVTGLGYRPVFFSSKLSLAAADLVAVTAPDETTGVDAIFLRGIFVPLINR